MAKWTNIEWDLLYTLGGACVLEDHVKMAFRRLAGHHTGHFLYKDEGWMYCPYCDRGTRHHHEAVTQAHLQEADDFLQAMTDCRGVHPRTKKTINSILKKLRTVGVD